MTEDALVLANGGAGAIAALAACGPAVLIQRGHVVDIGGSPLQLIAMASARAVEVGLADKCDAAEVENADATGGLFIGEGARPGLLDLPRFLWACHTRDRPAVVYLGGHGWIAALDAGADLIVIDLQRHRQAPGAVVAGRAGAMRRVREAVAALPVLLAATDEIAAAASAQVEESLRRSSPISDS